MPRSSVPSLSGAHFDRPRARAAEATSDLDKVEVYAFVDGALLDIFCVGFLRGQVGEALGGCHFCDAHAEEGSEALAEALMFKLGGGEVEFGLLELGLLRGEIEVAAVAGGADAPGEVVGCFAGLCGGAAQFERLGGGLCGIEGGFGL